MITTLRLLVTFTEARWQRWGLAVIVALFAYAVLTANVDPRLAHWGSPVPVSYVLIPAALAVAVLAFELAAIPLGLGLIYGIWRLIVLLPIPAAIVLGAFIIASAIRRRR